MSFVFDANSGTTSAPLLSSGPETGTAAQSTVNSNPEQVRAVIIELGVRNPIEDPSVEFMPILPDGGTRFEVNDAQKGSARVRNMRIEIPVMNVARSNL